MAFLVPYFMIEVFRQFTGERAFTGCKNRAYFTLDTAAEICTRPGARPGSSRGSCTVRLWASRNVAALERGQATEDINYFLSLSWFEINYFLSLSWFGTGTDLLAMRYVSNCSFSPHTGELA
jgi:hypothetical protein